MTFEKALEAMKQGKKVRRKSLSDDKIYLFIKDGKIMIHNPESMICISRPAMLGVDLILADDWEIYEEPQKEPEMTAEKAIEFLEMTDRIIHNVCGGFTETARENMHSAVFVAIKSLENQNQPEKKCELNQVNSNGFSNLFYTAWN